MKQSKVDKQIDKKIEAIYYRRCSGIAIPMMSIGDIFRAGREAFINGQDMEAAIVAAVEKVRV